VLSPGGGKHPAEFDAWRWEKLSRTPALIVPFKKDAYDKIVQAFADIPQRFAQP
jgi:putative (di)nucleoside polyphosphate hydrolase